MDPERWRLLLAGAPEAWDAFAAEFYPLVRRAVWDVLEHCAGRDGLEADELADEVFLRLKEDGCRRLGQYTPGRKIEKWLKAVAHHHACNRIKAAARGPVMLPLDEIGDIAAPPPPLDPALTADIHDDRLTPREEEVLNMRVVDGWSLKEVAKALGRSRNTVHVLYERAKHKLRSQPPVTDH